MIAKAMKENFILHESVLSLHGKSNTRNY